MSFNAGFAGKFFKTMREIEHLAAGLPIIVYISSFNYNSSSYFSVRSSQIAFYYKTFQLHL